MKLSDLKPAKGAKKLKKRIGRGNASGTGTYSGRGMKGQNSRKSGGVRIGFEGGQTPLLRRIPKLKGFKNINKITFSPINLATIEEKYAEDEIVSPESLIKKNILRKKTQPVKILGVGEITKKISFSDVAFSATAKEKIEKAGGKIENELVKEKSPEKKTKKEKKK